MWECIHLRLAAIVALAQGNETENVNSHLHFRLQLLFSVQNVLFICRSRTRYQGSLAACGFYYEPLSFHATCIRKKKTAAFP
ncbi:hypothetical protein V8C34DRAFT_283205 [Trichoderma compactum]